MNVGESPPTSPAFILVIKQKLYVAIHFFFLQIDCDYRYLGDYEYVISIILYHYFIYEKNNLPTLQN